MFTFKKRKVVKATTSMLEMANEFEDNESAFVDAASAAIE